MPIARRLATSLSSLALVVGLTAGIAQASEPVRLMAFGDSLVHGYGLDPDDVFPQQLEAALRDQGHEVEVINAGNSGDTTAAGLARIDWALADEPDAILVVLGANDGLRGLDPSETRRNLSGLLERLEEEELPTLFTGMLAPRNLGSDYAAEFDALFPRLAKAHDVVFYPFFLDGVVAEPALNQGDGIHPNAEGVAEIVARILPSVEELLSEVNDQAEAES
ncbi:arylesterase [Aquibaculum sediminis]|uniref:arylesterase n=1 Tax=Aquibaculum sediminis TaxID=3231907 RepID=UPI003451AD6A